jgi:hypothetical protein
MGVIFSLSLGAQFSVYGRGCQAAFLVLREPWTRFSTRHDYISAFFIQPAEPTHAGGSLTERNLLDTVY